MLFFKKCTADEDLKYTAEMANKIWNEHFISIITQGQIDYMLEKFQSYPAMKEQVKEGYLYYNFVLDGKKIGYFAVCPQSDNTLFLSKLYIKKEHRGRGYSSQAFEYIKGLADGLGLKSVWLTVNKHNSVAVSAYEALGMKNIRSQTTDIGGGYVMDDYVFSIDV